MLDFVGRSVEAIYSESKAQFEEITGRSVFDGQPEAQFLRLMAYRESLTRIALNQAANKNLVAYATGEYLDELGKLVGASRLVAEPAKAVLRIVPVSAMVLPAGTVVQSKSSKINYRTVAAVALPAGGANVDVAAVVPGTAGNGLVDITVLISSISGIGSITQVAASVGGSDQEVDDRYRQRIMEAPEHYSVAGPAGAYRYFAMSASALIRDVAVLSTAPGTVDVYVLADSDVKQVVSDALSDDKRPLTDNVMVHDAVAVSYNIELTYKVYSTADILSVGQQVASAVDGYITGLTNGMGADVVVSQLIKSVMSVDGVYSVDVISPAVDKVVQAYEVAMHTGAPVITYGGMVNG